MSSIKKEKLKKILTIMAAIVFIPTGLYSVAVKFLFEKYGYEYFIGKRIIDYSPFFYVIFILSWLYLISKFSLKKEDATEHIQKKTIIKILIFIVLVCLIFVATNHSHIVRMIKMGIKMENLIN